MLFRRLHAPSILSLLVVFLAAGFAPSAFASETDGTIDATNRYAWSENAGWIDFGTSEGNVHVTDAALTGYAWSELTGWISLHCSNTSSCATVDYKVTNNGEGTLGGYAWSENVGWIDFDPTNGGVTINSLGNFAGYAWGELVGWIVFNCQTTDTCGTVSYKVATDWRPVSARSPASSSASSSAPASGDSGGGGGRGGRGGGRRGSGEGMSERIAAAHAVIVARFHNALTPPVMFVQRDAPSSRRVVVARREAPAPETGSLSSASTSRLLARGVSLPASSASSSAGTPRPDRSDFPTRSTATENPAMASQALPSLTSPLRIAERRGRLLAMVDDAQVLYGDVPVQAWYAPYVATLITEGIAQGYRDSDGALTGEFGVAKSVTRAEMLKMALEAASVTLSGGSPRNLTAQGAWASPYVAQAEKMQLSTFAPSTDVNAPATRGEVVQTILEVLKFPLLPKGTTPFTDVPTDHPFARAVATASAYGIVSGDTASNGTPLGTFRPDDSISRAEVAKIIALVREVLK